MNTVESVEFYTFFTIYRNKYSVINLDILHIFAYSQRRGTWIDFPRQISLAESKLWIFTSESPINA